MFGSVFRRGSAVLVGLAVAAAMGVGLVSPATAAGPLPALVSCGGSMSSVTACGANVMMLQESGILAMPTATGGTVGVVATTNTAGSAVGGALGLLGGIAASWGLSGLFNAGGTTVQSGAALGADGLGSQTLTIAADADVNALGFMSTTDYSSMVGQTMTYGANTATVYAAVKIDAGSSAASNAYCLGSNSPGIKTDQSTDANAAPGFSWVGLSSWSGGSGNQKWNTTPPSFSGGLGCPASSGYTKFSWIQAAINGGANMLNKWSATFSSGAAGAKASVPPGVNPNLTPGTIHKHVWCAGPDGVLVDYMTAQALSLKPGQSVNLAEAKCPSGKAAADASIDWQPNNGTVHTIIPPTGAGTDATKQSPAVKSNLANPGCSAGGCFLQLQKISGESCGAIGELCPDWTRDPNYTQNYQCKFGGVVVALDTCSAYRAPKEGIQPNTKVDGTPYRPTDPVVKPGGQPVVDPNGKPDPTGKLPAPAPSTDPVTKADRQNCAPESWVAALNPFNLFISVGCAIKDAFTPSKDIGKESNDLKNKAMTKAPLSWVAAIGATAPASVGGQGVCPAWVVSISQTVNHQNTAFSKNVVCDSTFIQAIVNARSVLFGLISAGMLWPFLRSLWYAMIPVVRVIPTGGR